VLLVLIVLPLFLIFLILLLFVLFTRSIILTTWVAVLAAGTAIFGRFQGELKGLQRVYQAIEKPLSGE